MPIERKHISNDLRRHRMLHGFSQKEVAQKLGLISSSIISRWEKGISIPDLRNLLKLSCIYKTLIDQLYEDLRQKIAKDILLKDMENQNDIHPP